MKQGCASPATEFRRSGTRFLKKQISSVRAYHQRDGNCSLSIQKSEIIFQQDNAPVYNAPDYRHFFQVKEWNVLEWPAYSPDLNPTENLWAILKQRLRKQSFLE